ncbi:hypothetical protein S40285_09829 [Stachybotrys chlorohalonatus IBT 40285]|uniref:Uncharacterized protein n=1 Tax=Stachybotrys chlorohalonatus (strain IBT 40285) TaxID=1283841 RepID=A0A084QU77_STAC4|nr:hypothetical protein S40285_09829 [Stachybotrys chlorohalonata IBT 40285]
MKSSITYSRPTDNECTVAREPRGDGARWERNESIQCGPRTSNADMPGNSIRRVGFQPRTGCAFCVTNGISEPLAAVCLGLPFVANHAAPKRGRTPPVPASRIPPPSAGEGRSKEEEEAYLSLVLGLRDLTSSTTCC